MISKSTLAGAVSATVFVSGMGAASADSIRIGVLSDMSSMYASTSGMGSVEAVRMAAEEFGNEINGMPIEVVYADMQNKADIGSSIARRWLDSEDVDVIIDIPNSAVALAVQEVIRTRPEKLLLVTSAGTSDLSNSACAANSIQWTFDTYSQAAGLTRALADGGLKSWYYLTVDYAFGLAMERDSKGVLSGVDGSVTDGVTFPFNTADYASYLLSARRAKPQVLAFATGGSDTINSIKQAREFGLAQDGTVFAAFSLTEGNVTAIGMDAAEGAMTLTPFFWNRNVETTAFSETFKLRFGSYPSFVQAGTFSAARSYFEAVRATGTTDAGKLVEALRGMAINDVFSSNGKVREDGLMVHDMYLVAVKSPSEVTGADDIFKLEQVVAGDDAFRPLSASECPLVGK